MGTDHESKISVYGGIDTRKDTHHVAVIDEHGRPLGDREFGATSAGYRKVIDYLRGFGVVVAVAVEGTGSYGAELARVLRRAGMTVLEVARPDRRARRLRGKSDPLDALQAAVTALSGRGLATPKDRDGLVESMRIPLTERSSARKARGAAMNQIHALLVTAPEQIRATYRNLGNVKLVAALARSRPTRGHGPEQTLRGSLKRLAVRHQQHTSDIDGIDTRLGELAAQVNPALLQLPGVGLLVASQLLVGCGDNPERLSSEQQFAALCGTAPIPASSGKHQRHRLSRGGDRTANSAIHRIVLVWMSAGDTRTVDYIARRTAEGKSEREIIRCLKRFVAREVFKIIRNPLPVNNGTGRLHQRRRTLAIPITTVATALAVPYQRVRRLEIGQRLDPDLAATYSRWLTDREQPSSSLSLADTA
ncbi:IS110 family transposase [Rhodococcus jostii]|uniref:IS110 family transposase n=1 Tax=Rhodococcus jostii TaxID=132919 RepID=UPI0036321049